MATTSFSNWDFANQRVQSELTGGQFINAESTLIAAGPPSLAGDPGTMAVEGEVYPVGLLETFGLQQSRQLQRIFEIGSSRSYFIPGRTIGSITLGRTFYHGPSLLRVLYASYSMGGVGAFNSVSTINIEETVNSITRRKPGYGEFLIDLASPLFNNPTGMAVYFKDCNMNTYGAFYLENCYTQGHQLTVSSGSVLIMEGASLQYDLLVPIDVAAPLMASEPTEG